jgi:hypothetical protein
MDIDNADDLISALIPSVLVSFPDTADWLPLDSRQLVMCKRNLKSAEANVKVAQLRSKTTNKGQTGHST